MSAGPSAVRRQPPSPPRSNDGDFDLSAVQQHVAELNQYAAPPMTDSTGLARDPVDHYGDPSEYQTGANPAYYPAEGGFHGTNHPATPPITGYDRVMRTRSGRSLGSPLTSANPETSRRSRSPRPRAKRPPRNASANKKKVHLAEPLSIMTKDWTISLGDVEAKVQRSAEQRQEEVHNKKNNGRIPRPMNSFMLYRSAYADRVKEYCKEGNHQIISQITGVSWAMEPQEIKKLYERYAQMDRQNHQEAHPEYKFAPNKNGLANKKRKGDDDDDDTTEWGDRDYEASSTHTKRSRHGYSVESRSQTSSPFEAARQPEYRLVPAGHRPNPSSYHASNPRSIPPTYPVNVNDHYYEQWATPYGNNVEDIHVRRVQHPDPMAYNPIDDQSLIGLPHGTYPNHGQQQFGGYDMPQQVQMDALDPRLGQYGGQDLYPPQYGANDSVETFEPQQYDYGQDDIFASQQYEYPGASVHPGMATLTSPGGPWDQHLPASDFDEELGRWPI